MKIVTANEMRLLERQAAEQGLTSEILMENAGLGVAKEIQHLCGGVIGKCIVVLVGPGNNGGDGLVAARYLHTWGASVRIYLCQRNPISTSPVVNIKSQQGGDKNLDLVLELGIPIIHTAEDKGLTSLESNFVSAYLVLDALLGTGKARPIEGIMAQVVQKLTLAKAKHPRLTVVSLDLPSGLNPDTGAMDTNGVNADITITLGYPKVGLFSFPGAQNVGELKMVDIGLPATLGRHISLELITSAWAGSVLPPRPLDANKGSFGRALVFAGSINYIGAAYLACAGASRSGAGLVTLATPCSLVPILAGKITEATYLPLTEASTGLLSDSDEFLEIAQTFDVCLMGCGLGQSPGATKLVKRITASDEISTKCWVIDADALNILSQVSQWWSACRRLGTNTILTPHPGEMARLTGYSVEEIQSNRVKVAREMAIKWGKIVALKGAFTVIANPEGNVMLSPFANPGLSSPGTGDVLSGIIAGLAAQGLTPRDAAACGVYLHGASGEMICNDTGNAGILASDLLPAIPKAIKKLKEGSSSGSRSK